MTDGNTWDGIEDLGKVARRGRTLGQRAFDEMVAKRERQVLKGCDPDTRAFWEAHGAGKAQQ